MDCSYLPERVGHQTYWELLCESLHRDSNGYSESVMDLSPLQLTTLCSVFVGLHLIALPPFLWALRHRQFSGREQKEWYLDDPEVPAAPPAEVYRNVRGSRWLLAILSFLALTMLASVFLVMFVALHASAHPAAGKCPF